MASFSLNGIHDDDFLLRNRLITRTTVTRGESPLKKVKRKFSSFCDTTSQEKTSLADAELAAKSFLQELDSFFLPLKKAKLVVEANSREQRNFQNVQKLLESQIAKVESEIVEAKKEMELAKKRRSQNEEYETVKILIAAEPTRITTETAINKLEEEIESLEKEDEFLSEASDLKSKQFKFLLNMISLLEESNPISSQKSMDVVPNVPNDKSSLSN